MNLEEFNRAEVPNEPVEEVVEETIEEPTEEVPEETEEVIEEVAEEETPEEVDEELVDKKTEEPPEEAKKEEPVEEKPEKKEPDNFAIEAKKLFPDREFKDDTELQGAVLDRVTELEVYRQDNDTANRKVVEVLEAQPEIGEIIKDMAQGSTFPEALARHVDVEALTPVEGDPDLKAWDKAKGDREKRIKASKKFQVTLQKNRTESVKNIEAFRADKKLSELEMTGFTTDLQKVLAGVMDGHITNDFLGLMYKGMKYDVAVAEGRKQGEVKGRNEKIVAEDGKQTAGVDGLPDIKSQGPPKEKKAANNDAAQFVDFVQKSKPFDNL